MQRRWLALLGAVGGLCVALAADAQARCFPDALGAGVTCETTNQARQGAALTKSDATVLNPPTRGVYIGDAAACNIAVLFADDTAAVTLANVQPGVAYPLAIKKLMSTNTTCTAVTALY